MLCAWAGRRKESESASGASLSGRPLKSGAGILLCVLSGIGGSDDQSGLGFWITACRFGPAAPDTASLPSQCGLAPLLFFGFIPSSLYCFPLLLSNRTWPLFFKRESVSHWLWALLMAVLWLGSVEVYGVATGHLGNWGPSWAGPFSCRPPLSRRVFGVG